MNIFYETIDSFLMFPAKATRVSGKSWPTNRNGPAVLGTWRVNRRVLGTFQSASAIAVVLCQCKYEKMQIHLSRPWFQWFQKIRAKAPDTLILTANRELCEQVADVARRFTSQHFFVNCVCLPPRSPQDWDVCHQRITNYWDVSVWV